jgi:hypothetical protein
MPKVQPIVELLNCTLASSFGKVPPKADCSITKVNFFQGSYILLFITKSFVLILEFKNNELLNVHVE